MTARTPIEHLLMDELDELLDCMWMDDKGEIHFDDELSEGDFDEHLALLAASERLGETLH